MMHGKHIDVSYFAAGILAHLCCDGDVAWRSLAGLDRYDIMEDLVHNMYCIDFFSFVWFLS